MIDYDEALKLTNSSVILLKLREAEARCCDSCFLRKLLNNYLKAFESEYKLKQSLKGDIIEVTKNNS